MKKVRLARLPDRVPVKMQVTLPPDLAAGLRDYADLYAETYGVREEPADLVPFMLDAFLRGDAEFRKAMRGKAGKGKESDPADGSRSERSLCPPSIPPKAAGTRKSVNSASRPECWPGRTGYLSEPHPCDGRHGRPLNVMK